MGCESSKSVQSKDQSVSMLDEFNPKSTPLSSRYVENTIVVCLETSTQHDQSIQQWKEKLRQVINVVEIFTDATRCRAFIAGIKHERILLIISDLLDEEFARDMTDQEQVSCIFVVCFHESQHKGWTPRFRGIRGLFSSVVTLSQQFIECRDSIDHELVGFALLGDGASPNLIDRDQQDVQLMFGQIFLELLLIMDENDLEDMIHYISKLYRTNAVEETFLNEFRTSYRSKSPIYWYLRRSCLNRMLSKALRLQHYETLCHLRVFIRHLLQAFHAQYDKTRPVNMKLYRGFAMNKTELDRIRKHQGRLMMISNLFSTTSDPNLAVALANKSLYHKRRTRILMIIDVQKYTDVPLINVRNFGISKDDEDWLFSVGSVFRVGSANLRPDGIWEITMTLTDEYDEQLMAWKEYLEKSLNKQIPYFSLAKLMFQLDEWSLAERFYLMHLERETSLQTRATVLNNIGLIKTELKQYQEALNYFEQSAKLEEGDKQVNVQDRALHYNNMAYVYYQQNEMSQAMNYFQKAIDLLDDASNRNEEMRATLYNNMATILNDIGKHQDALEYNKKCLQIRLQIFPPMHPMIANAYNGMASTLDHLKSYTEALDYAQKAISIDRRTLPPGHLQTSVHMRNLDVVKKHKKFNV